MKKANELMTLCGGGAFVHYTDESRLNHVFASDEERHDYQNIGIFPE